MDWAGWALFGLVATALLTVVMIAAQLGGLSRLDLPLILGTLVAEDPDRARVAGLSSTSPWGRASLSATPPPSRCSASRPGGWAPCWVCCTSLSPSPCSCPCWLASIPAWRRAGPGSTAALEPPGVLGLNYGLPPIGDYGLIGDTRTAALVSADGAIDWLCIPGFDGDPMFGRLVGGPEAGTFRLGPACRSC